MQKCITLESISQLEAPAAPYLDAVQNVNRALQLHVLQPVHDKKPLCIFEKFHFDPNLSSIHIIAPQDNSPLLLGSQLLLTAQLLPEPA